MKTGNGKSDFLWAVLGGAVVMFVLSVTLTALSAVLIRGGMLPSGGTPATVCVIAFISALIGGICCAAYAKKAKLPLCLASVAVFLLCIFVLRGLIFRTVGDRPWLIPVWAVIGAVLGALIANIKIRR